MKGTIISIIIATALIGGALFLGRGGTQEAVVPAGSNVSIAGGTQIIEIRAKGGYIPRSSTAKAGIPTILRFNTSGTFDCSSIVRIPSMNITKNLSPSGKTDIELGTRQVGVLQGSCGMGMYPFEIDFQT